jgi:uncharacterized protein
MNLVTIKQKLQNLKPELHERFGVSEIGVFGSFVRGEEKKGSDLDVLVGFYRPTDLFDLMDLEAFLTKKLRKKIDLAPKDSLRPVIGQYILNEVQMI